MSPTVGLAKSKKIAYPGQPPYHPGRAYPELSFLPADAFNNQPENYAYEAVRQSLYLAGLDAQNFGSENWNPLGNYISPGDKVLLKPNYVFQAYNRASEDCIITHGAIIRAALDYVYLAGGPTCQITIADAPEQAANFDLILEQTGIKQIVAFYQEQLNYSVAVLDLRKVTSEWDNKSGFLPPAKEQNGDPLGYVRVNLGSASELEPITHQNTRFGIMAYSLDALQERHRPGYHEYLVSKTILTQDVIINLPKMKTHQKAGLTGGLKNLVGINGSKDWLPHYRLGSPQAQGDEHPPGETLVSANRSVKGALQRRSRLLWNIARKAWHIISRFTPDSAQLPSGAWHGNDTTWRMALDLNKIVVFADAEGQLHPNPQRKLFCIMDGIIAGQGDGPLSPKAKPVGIVMAGADGAAIDAIVAQLIGYNRDKLPLIARFAQPPGAYWFSAFNGQNVKIITSDGPLTIDDLESMDFEPPPGWIGQIEANVKA